MTVRHHIADELLVAYEAGSLSEGENIAVATHLALCPHCRVAARAATAVGGAMLEGAEPIPIRPDALDRVLDRIAAPPVADRPRQRAAVETAGAPPILPEPLRSYVGGDIDRVPWRRLGLKARHYRIPLSDRTTVARLLCIPAGQPVPMHGHRGLELTVVLSGTLVDGHDRLGRGDVEQTDESVEHQPRAGEGEDCICLAVTDAPLRFKGLVARLAQNFLRI